MKELKKPTKIKDQISHDEEVAQRLQAQLQAEFEEEERLTREKEEEANIVSWDNVQATIDADYQMALKLKKYFAALRAEEKRNKPPTKAQKRNTMVNIVDMDTKLVEESFKKAEADIAHEGSSKRAKTKLEQEESAKKQKVNDAQETAKMKEHIKVVPDEKKVEINAIPLATKPPSIVDRKIHKEGQTSFYQITRADGISKMYKVFSQLLKSFDREDLETLWRLVKAKHGDTRPE
ncbi:hypothetical protein Tco_0656359 [Tanacetum coccineum]|uniref:Uncharacterized protein n=1 Tax=Tanacetum coccineum TaxID=301880 RepID=A0ABQ4X8J3_9ASTR